MVSLFERTDEENKFSFDKDNTAYSVAEFLSIAKVIDGKTLVAKITDKTIEQWQPFVKASKSEKLVRVRERIQSHQIIGVRGELFKVLTSWSWLFEQLKSMCRISGWRLLFRATLVTVLFILGYVFNSWVFYAPALAAVCLVVSAFLIGALSIFRPDIKIPASTYDGLKFAVELLTGIVGAMLALISGHTGSIRIAAVTLAISLVLGVFAVYNVITAIEAETSDSITINSASWDWIETLLLLQFLSFIAGGVALTLNVLN
jgi:hypothetical protein